ncbi:MAG TPA: histidine ammonia-lyase, partial [Terriglobia bacterium]|nr:histidine ammonia-lyase [Terriglobia bacterium]
NLTAILAIELVAACQAIDLLAPLQTGTLARKAQRLVREVSPAIYEDRALSAEITRVGELVASGKIAAVLP